MGGPCSKSCGAGGSRTRSRRIARNATNGGKECSGNLEKVEWGCGRRRMYHCPIDCATNDWSTWSNCSLSCHDGVSGGIMSRSRSVTRSPRGDGKSCPDIHQTKNCNPGRCPVNCVVSHWYEWDTCSAPCGMGTQMRLREVQQKRAHGGSICPHLNETRQCIRVACPVNCELSDWSTWSNCSASCG